jgi:putative peptidoglycan lipid II flippase
VVEGKSRQGDAAPLSGRRLGAAAGLLALSVLLSRVLGFVREMVLAAQVGVGTQTDAYYAAFQIPDLLNYLLAGGALAIAFTPLYLSALQEGEDSADALLRTVLGTLGAIAVVLTVALWIGADALVALQFPSFDAETRELTVALTRIVLPGQIFFVAGGIVRAVLMAHGRFRAQAMAPLIYNSCIIAGGWIDGGVHGFAWGALFGAVLGAWAYPLHDMRHVGAVRMRVAPFDPRFHAYLWQALPLMVGLSLTTVDEWYERWFGARVGEGVVASLGFARRLMMAPVAVIGQAVAAAALPTLAALHAAGRSGELDETLQKTLRATLGVAILTAALFFVLADPFVEAMYRRGRFGLEDSRRVAGLLAILTFAVPAWVTQQVAVRAFFARAETWRPMGLGTVLALAVIPLYVALGDGFGAEGLAAAGVLAISLNALATLGWARVRFGGPALMPLLSTAARTALAAGLAGGLSWWALGAYADPAPPGLPGALLRLVVGGSVYGAAALVAIRLLDDGPIRELLGDLTSRASRVLGRLRGPGRGNGSPS